MILYYLFLFLIPFQQHPILGAQLVSIAGFPITPIKVLGFLMVAVSMVVARPKDAAPRPPSGIFILVAAFAIYPVIGTVLSFQPFPGHVLSTFFSFIILMVATNNLICTPQRLQYTIRAAVLAETFASTWLYKQYYIYHWSRPMGPSSDPNYEALSLVLTVPLAIWLALYEERPAWRRTGLVCAPILAFAVFVSQSRGGLLALVVISLLGWTASRYKFRLAVALIVGATLLLVLGPASMRERLQQIRFGGPIASGPELSTWSRWELAVAAIHMMEAHPVFGIGLDQFKHEEVRYNPHLITADPYPHITHNTYLQLGAEGGLPTMFLYLAILFITLSTCREVEKSPGASRDLASLAYFMRIGIIGYMVAAIFLSAQFVKEPWVFIALAPNMHILAFYKTSGRKRARRPSPVGSPQRVLTTRYDAG
ncbi:MAG TPA: O-antigen ligase family protein [Candidatus Binataceae bacterium]|nr:O-antigen ligase family protein [Candidatus Binataceae bacterium]